MANQGDGTPQHQKSSKTPVIATLLQVFLLTPKIKMAATSGNVIFSFQKSNHVVVRQTVKISKL